MHWVLAELGRRIGSTARQPSRVLDVLAQIVRRCGRWGRDIEDLDMRHAVAIQTSSAITRLDTAC
jgi:hypothetical protein